ncbi:ABC transporter substrate-binding protein [Microbacterium sp. LRZ72]|uniref:ABC transporter substrate-binding protein n=1 Tax=Microbacterium sp. LRZ72 TaxID=2942481 RepID=UPI0029A2B37D|nr:ABC transporter substrate-binding protein [Microbacterium sp. LRZ72]MDX2377856.1 ABC transporter substrate-binding protein [Microbacterium sp. LRZ72]
MRARFGRSVAAGLGGLVVLALAVSGCGTGGDADTGGDSDSTLTMAHDGNTQINFDPGVGSITVTTYLAPVYDTLLRRLSDGSYEPNLATEWGYESPTEFSMTLRDDVTFADGTPLDAAAVVANLENVKNGTGPLASDFATIDSIEAVDDNRVVITLSTPNPSLPLTLSGVSGMIANPAAIEGGELATQPDGSGPYEYLADESISNDTYVYEKRDDYWASDDYPYDRIEVKVIPDAAAAVNALESGQVDMVELGTAGDIVRVENAGLDFTGASNNVWTLHLEDRAGELVPALGEVEVRQALNHAIDRAAIVESVNQGLGSPTTQLVKPGMAGYDETLNNVYPYDPEMARELLAEAGYPDGFEMDAVSISLADTQVQALVGYLAEVGVTLNVVNVPPDQYIPSILSGEYPTAFLPYGMVDAYFDFGQLVTPEGGFNPMGSSDEQINDLYAEAGSATNDEERAAILEQLNARVVELAWFLPMFNDAYGYALSDDVTGVEWQTFRPPMYYQWAPAD